MLKRAPNLRGYHQLDDDGGDMDVLSSRTALVMRPLKAGRIHKNWSYVWGDTLKF